MYRQLNKDMENMTKMNDQPTKSELQGEVRISDLAQLSSEFRREFCTTFGLVDELRNFSNTLKKITTCEDGMTKDGVMQEPDDFIGEIYDNLRLLTKINGELRFISNHLRGVIG